jgi:hypothetical protein
MTEASRVEVASDKKANSRWRASTRRLRTHWRVAAGIVGVSIAALIFGITIVGAPHQRPAVISSPQRRAPATQAPLGSGLANLPVNVALTGTTAIAWADYALLALGAPKSPANVKTMVDWFANEGAPHDFNNPLDLQTPFGGSVISTAGGSPAADRIQSYPSPADFVAAFPLEMNNGSYNAIVAALKTGNGLEGAAANPAISFELSVYSGGGYNSIPAAYNK